MKYGWLKLVVLVLVLAALGGMWLHSRHILLTPHGWIVVPKAFRCWHETWVDARHWTWPDYAARPRLLMALESAGYRPYLRELQRDYRVARLRAGRDVVLGRISAACRVVRSWLPWNRERQDAPNPPDRESEES